MFIAQGFEWATHQPLIKAILDLYDPKFVLELGCGIFSTPLFMDREAMFIENDIDWIEHIKNEFGIDVIYHDLGEVHDCDFINDLTGEQDKQFVDYYESLIIPDLKPNLLFVDHVPSCRVISINTLRGKFDIIMYHDCDDIGMQTNNYHLINKEGFNSYVLTTNRTGTCVMIRKEVDKGSLNEALKLHIKEFQEKYPECTKMELQ
ncbi:MAG TPA: hypothetical protein VMV77_18355 [Bacteroidales bacterium]|nr:hypothetical protein [Bacteroidales bacterium]